MHHVMLVKVLWLMVLRTVENYVARPHLIKFKFDWQCIELIRLIPRSQSETEVVFQVVYSSANESTAVEKDR